MATEVTMAGLATLSSEASFSGAPTDASSNVASFSSTPPTTVSPDSMSLASDPEIPASKQDAGVAPLLDAAIPLLENEQSEQQESGQQTPVGQAIVVAQAPLSTEPLSTSRPRRARASLLVYNLSVLAGTDNRAKRRAKDDTAGEKRRRTISGDTLVNGDANGASGSTDAPNSGWSLGGPNTPQGTQMPKKSTSSLPAAQITRRATRLSGVPAETLATKLAALGKRSKKTLEKMSRELRQLQDTNEFAHIDTRPVRYTVWSNGKYVDPAELEEAAAAAAAQPPRKKVKVDESAAGDGAGAAAASTSVESGAEPGKKEAEETAKPETEGPALRKRRIKKWLDKGLYAGQEAPIDIFKGLTSQEKKKLASIPELLPSGKPNKTLPMPMFNGLRILINGRDFKLPYDVCNPLPPGQPKPAAYRTTTRNRFVGDAAAYWKKTPHFEDFASKCVCKPEDGCAEDCQNRIMLYECDETNCNVGKEHCQNRAFQNLQERTKKGGRYRVGVEVFKTGDRGYGVRSNRCFEANQIIMEYTGEIITEEECERRMNEVYKDNECYYLMSFDQNMIIDATTGSIARFVNHSCSPNCRMIKWIVSGQPRMALFAGDRPIMTGEELTYDYNFDPFSAKNVQKCLCGSPNCRGVLGPKPKEVKPPKSKDEAAKKKGSVKGSVKAGKRKLKEFLAGEKDDAGASKAAKKVKAKPAANAAKPKGKGKVVKAVVRGKGTALKTATKGAGKGAATVFKRGVSKVSVKAKSALSKKTAAGYVASRGQGLKQTKITFKTRTPGPRKSGTTRESDIHRYPAISSATVSSSAGSTIVAAGASPAGSTSAKSTPKSTSRAAAEAPVAGSAKSASARKRTPSRKALESATQSPAGSPMVKGKAAQTKIRAVQQSVYDFPN